MAKSRKPLLVVVPYLNNFKKRRRKKLRQNYRIHGQDEAVLLARMLVSNESTASYFTSDAPVSRALPRSDRPHPLFASLAAASRTLIAPSTPSRANPIPCICSL